MTTPEEDDVTVADTAREVARQRTGQFGAQQHSAPEVELVADAETDHAPKSWTMTVTYAGGGFETFTVDENGILPRPVRSDSLSLVRLVGFMRTPFSPRTAEGVDIPISFALADSNAALGLSPVFETYDGHTMLRARVSAFAAAG